MLMAPDLALLQQQKGYDKTAKEVDPAIPAFTRRREVQNQYCAGLLCGHPEAAYSYLATVPGCLHVDWSCVPVVSTF